MIDFSVTDILRSTSGKLINQGSENSCKRISTDTREIEVGDLFIALIGDNFDGHKFLSDAYDKGCRMCVVSDRNINVPPKMTAVLVDDTLTALGSIATFYRRSLSVKIIAITGSNGKTTTKDILAQLLNQSFNIAMTQGTKNNLIGVPQTIFAITPHHDIAVIELGINRFGEMERLGEITKPDIAILTNIGASHLEQLKTEDGVFKAKSELFKKLKENGKIIANKNDPYFDRIKTNHNIVSFGIDNDADYCANNLTTTDNGTKIDIFIRGENQGTLFLPIKGTHNVSNFMAALAGAMEHGVSWEKIKETVVDLSLPEMRMDISVCEKITIINDAYNANPASVSVAIEELKRIKTTGKKIFVFADMFELGEKSEAYHREIGKIINSSDINILITIGELAKYTYEETSENPEISAFRCKNHNDVLSVLKKSLSPHDVVLFKGSRSNRLEKIVNNLKNYLCELSKV